MAHASGAVGGTASEMGGCRRGSAPMCPCASACRRPENTGPARTRRHPPPASGRSAAHNPTACPPRWTCGLRARGLAPWSVSLLGQGRMALRALSPPAPGGAWRGPLARAALRYAPCTQRVASLLNAVLPAEVRRPVARMCTVACCARTAGRSFQLQPEASAAAAAGGGGGSRAPMCAGYLATLLFMQVTQSPGRASLRAACQAPRAACAVRLCDSRPCDRLHVRLCVSRPPHSARVCAIQSIPLPVEVRLPAPARNSLAGANYFR